MTWSWTHCDPMIRFRRRRVEVDDVVLDTLRPDDQVPEEAGVRGRNGTHGVFHRPDGGDGVHGRADAANALGEGPRVARIAALEDQLDSPEHRGGGPGVLDESPVHLGFDSEMPFDAGDGIDDDVRHGRSPFPTFSTFSTFSTGSTGGGGVSPPFGPVERWISEITPCVAKTAATPAVARRPTLSMLAARPKPGTFGRGG